MTDQRIIARPIQLEDANLFDITGPISQIDTAAGELVTVTLQDVVDAFVRTFTLVIPKAVADAACGPGRAPRRVAGGPDPRSSGRD